MILFCGHLCNIPKEIEFVLFEQEVIFVIFLALRAPSCVLLDKLHIAETYCFSTLLKTQQSYIWAPDLPINILFCNQLLHQSTYDLLDFESCYWWLIDEKLSLIKILGHIVRVRVSAFFQKVIFKTIKGLFLGGETFLNVHK